MKKNIFGKEKKMERPDEFDQITPDEAMGEAEKPDEEIVIEDAQSADDEQPTQEQWRDALTKAVAQRDEYLALAQRTQADFQNFKRRNEKTRSDAYQDGVREVIAALLPTVDNFERAIEAAKNTESEEVKALLEGVEMTQRQLMEALSKMGLEEIPALGEVFNPDVHDAVMRSEGGEPGTVTGVFQKGYKVGERVIRYAMVQVAAE